jgi:hypothetical protein
MITLSFSPVRISSPNLISAMCTILTLIQIVALCLGMSFKQHSCIPSVITPTVLFYPSMFNAICPLRILAWDPSDLRLVGRLTPSRPCAGSPISEQILYPSIWCHDFVTPPQRVSDQITTGMRASMADLMTTPSSGHVNTWRVRQARPQATCSLRYRHQLPHDDRF